MQNIHPWERRPCSRSSGIALSTLRATSCSPRIDDLAKPKIKREHCIRQGSCFFLEIHKSNRIICFFLLL